MMLSVLGNVSCEHEPKVKAKGKTGGIYDGVPSPAA